MEIKINVSSNINTDNCLNECKEILKDYNITFDNKEIVKESRDQVRVFVRCLIAFILRQKGYTFQNIGIILNRNHSNVIHMMKYGHRKGTENLRQRYIKTTESIKEKLELEKIKEQSTT